MSEADRRKDITVEEYISSLEGDVQADARTLVDIMSRVSKETPQLYGYGTVGFGVYHYKYQSGREGDAHTLAFYPRKGKITLYLMDGTARYAKLLEKLGKHTTTGYCVYIKRLSDVDLGVLEAIIRESYAFITSTYKSGSIDRILWQTEK